MPQGSAIDLVIIEAADAVGLTLAQAEQQLTQAGLRVRNVFTEKTIPIDFGSLPPVGKVARTSPLRAGKRRRTVASTS